MRPTVPFEVPPILPFEVPLTLLLPGITTAGLSSEPDTVRGPRDMRPVSLQPGPVLGQVLGLDRLPDLLALLGDAVDPPLLAILRDEQVGQGSIA